MQGRGFFTVKRTADFVLSVRGISVIFGNFPNVYTVLDFVYNCGPANWNASTLKKYIESGRKTWEIQEQFLKWVNAGGKKLGGLVTRRIWEANRFNE
jgi:GH24 family phage-related lysozyme (muramidase)